ncbi:MAG: hypothetical protein WHV44_15170, partial [Anaerolineales bacterium]
EPFPVRLDFFGDEIDSIRRFDPASQRTMSKLDSVLVTPAREYLFTPGALNGWDMAAESEPSEFWIPVLHPMPASLFDYLPPRGLVLVDDLGLVESMVGEVEEQAVRFRQESIEEGTLPEKFPLPYITWPEFSDSLHSRPWLELGHATAAEGDSTPGGLRDLFTPDQRFGGRLKPFIDHLAALVKDSRQVIVVSRQVKRLQELWFEHPAFHNGEQDAERALQNPAFVEASLSEGWTLRAGAAAPVHLITDSEIFGWERPTPRARQRP